MASTNKTTNYELSQYIGTDKPTYLTDYNQDMSKIDAGIHAAKSEADTNASAIGTLSSLTTDTKTSIVGAINEVDSHADTNAGNIATNTSNIATNTTHIGTLANLTTASKTDLVVASNEINAKVGDISSLTTTSKSSTVSAINELDSKFEFTNITSLTGGTVSGSGSIIERLKLATNSDGSVFKLYGTLIASGQVNTVTYQTSLRPSTNIDISGVLITFRNEGIEFNTISISTSGEVTIPIYTATSATAFSAACTLFLQDFED